MVHVPSLDLSRASQTRFFAWFVACLSVCFFDCLFGRLFGKSVKKEPGEQGRQEGRRTRKVGEGSFGCLFGKRKARRNK